MFEQMNEDVELAEAMALAGVILSKKPRLERSQNKPSDALNFRRLSRLTFKPSALIPIFI